jgi:hypothetical protein
LILKDLSVSFLAAILIEKANALDFKGSLGVIFIDVNVIHIRFVSEILLLSLA